MVVSARSAVADLKKVARSSGCCGSNEQCSEKLEAAVARRGCTPKLVKETGSGVVEAARRP